MKKIISFDKNLDFKSMIGEISSISLDHTLSFDDESSISGDFLISGKYKLTEATRLEEDFNFKLPVEIMLGEKLEEVGRKIEIDDFHYEVENDDSLACHIEVKIEGVEVIEEDEEIVEEPLQDVGPREEKGEELVPEVAPMEERNESVSDKEDSLMADGVISLEGIQEEERECDGDSKTDEEKQDVEPVEVISQTELAEVIPEMEIAEVVEKKAPVKEEVITMEQESEKTEDASVGSLFSSFKDSDETFATYSVYIVRHDETIESIMDKYQVTKEQLESYNNLANIEVGSKIIIPASHE